MSMLTARTRKSPTGTEASATSESHHRTLPIAAVGRGRRAMLNMRVTSPDGAHQRRPRAMGTSASAGEQIGQTRNAFGEVVVGQCVGDARIAWSTEPFAWD